MNTGEKIRYYREHRGLTQQQLADVSGVPLNSINKYEIGNRNPKLNALEKIANALCISVSVFHDIECIDDMIPSFIAFAKLGGLKFHGCKDENGTFCSEGLTFSFDSSVLMQILKEWADGKSVVDSLRAQAESVDDKIAKEFLLHRADMLEKSMELTIMDSVATKRG